MELKAATEIFDEINRFGAKDTRCLNSDGDEVVASKIDPTVNTGGVIIWLISTNLKKMSVENTLS